ncbi:outer membrane beta-barrel protein [Singulisphaera sp. PoT]|uniref:outer membrane beta-barrel protein n=1 Tax=Singulisphaera sp. PoT TaxID=3411797 RepID=UPI003BF4DA4F
MRRPIVQGVGVLGLLWGIGGGESVAQVSAAGSYPLPAPTQAAQAPRSSYAYPPAADNLPVRTSYFQDGGAVPPTPSPSIPSPTGTFSGTEPPSPSGSSGPANETDVALPRAERAGGGGEPTEAEAGQLAAEEAKEEEKEGEPEKDESKLLMNFFNRADKPVKVYGWIQNSYTGNTGGVPPSGYNFGVNPNFLANRWMGNQYYLIIENPLEQNDRINFGFRVDNLFGNDWQFNHMRGLNEHSFRLNHFLGYDPAQMYAEVHLPFLTKGGIDIKGGRFYTILGYEVVPATGRPLLSVPYMFNYGQPFTHLGMMSTLHLTDRVNVYNGVVNGYDRWFDANYKWNYIGGVTWTSESGKSNFAISYIFGPNQYPYFLNGSSQNIYLLGNTIPPHLDGRRNTSYGSNNRASVTMVYSYKWNDKLTQVMEVDLSYENNIPGSGGIPQSNGTFVGGLDRNDSWQGFGNWFLYAFGDKLTGVWRSEVFRDDGGQRTGFRDNFYEMTVGLIYKPKPWLWIRPEARYDWTQFTHPFYDGTKKSQLTLAVDAILLY